MRKFTLIITLALVASGLFSFVATNPASAHGVCTVTAVKPVVGHTSITYGSAISCDKIHNFLDMDFTDLDRRGCSSCAWQEYESLIGLGCTDCKQDSEGRTILSGISGTDFCDWQWRTRTKWTVSGHGPYTDNSAPTAFC